MKHVIKKNSNNLENRPPLTNAYIFQRLIKNRCHFMSTDLFKSLEKY